MQLDRRELFRRTAGAGIAMAVPGLLPQPVTAPVTTLATRLVYAPQELIDDAILGDQLEAYICQKMTEEFRASIDRYWAEHEQRT